jgi:hypothetical protein
LDGRTRAAGLNETAARSAILVRCGRLCRILMSFPRFEQM